MGAGAGEEGQAGKETREGQWTWRRGRERRPRPWRRGRGRCPGPGERDRGRGPGRGEGARGGRGASESRARPVGLIDRGERKRGRPEDGQEWTRTDYKNRTVPARAAATVQARNASSLFFWRRRATLRPFIALGLASLRVLLQALIPSMITGKM